MFQLLRYYAPYKKLLTLAVVCNLLMSVFMVISIPVLQPFLQILFNRNTSDKQSPTLPEGNGFAGFEAQSKMYFNRLIAEQGHEKALLVVCAMLILVFFGKNLFRYLSLYFLAPVRNGIVRDFRQKMVNKMLELPLSFFSNERKGDLMSRFTSDVQEIEWSIVGVMEAIVREPIVILGSLAFMVYISPSLTVFVFGLLVFTALIIGGIGRSLRKQSGEAQTRLGYIVSLVEETLGGLRIIKGFNAEAYQRERFATENKAYARSLTRIYRRRDVASPLSEFLGICVVSVLLWYGARQVFSGTLSAETFITFLYAFFNVIDPAKAFSSAIYSIRKGMGAVERVQSVLEADLVIHDQTNAQQINGFQDKIEFKNVSFQYPNAERPALQEVSLSIPKGKRVALVGASGAGKSTIADLLPRFYDVNSGQITIDGKDIRDVRTRELRALLYGHCKPGSRIVQ